MGLSWLGTSSILLLLVVTLLIALPRLTRRTYYFTSIQAQKSADDILADEPSSEAPENALSAANFAELCFHERQEFEQDREAPQQRLIPRKSRLVLFGAAALCLLVCPITGLLAWATNLTWVLPFTALTLGLAFFAILRLLAIADAKKKGLQFRAAPKHTAYSDVVLKKPEHSRNISGTYEPQVASSVLDKKADPVELSVPVATRPVKHEQQKPVSYAAKSLRYARTHRVQPRVSLEGTAGQRDMTVHEAPHRALKPAQVAWERTDLPQPTYLDVEEARPLPLEPLHLPEHEKSRSHTLAEAVEIGTNLSELSLDDILKRRRA